MSTVSEDDESVHTFPPDCDTSLLQQFLDHERSGWGSLLEDKKEYLAGIELLSLLRKTRSPLYIFDEIINWVQKSILTYGMNFSSCYRFTRKRTLQQIERRYNLNGLSPKSEKIFLSGYNCSASVVFHDFKQCLYSLLTDADLMRKENLLLGENGSLLYEPQPDIDILDDIGSGYCYRLAYKKYIQEPDRQLLCPIIFFFDKTHTDTHGRLCLEPLQFTLGIFKRDVRNMAKSWRSLGYVTDIINKENSQSSQKMQDYHSMLNILLRSFKEAQKSPIIWKFEIEDVPKITVALKIPVLFVIGDTEGHDKLCGRYASRRKPPRLCRYCTVPFPETDNPYAKFKPQKCKQIEKMVDDGREDDLKRMSFHCIRNAWSDVQFCDSERGIFGATLAELLHCLQQGIFEYGIKALYDQKKIRKGTKRNRNRKRKFEEEENEEFQDDDNDTEEEEEEEEVVEDEDDDNDADDDNEVDGDEDEEIENELSDLEDEEEEEIIEPQDETEDEGEEDDSEGEEEEEEGEETIEYSSHYVFPKHYCAKFDSLCRKYGKYLQHQSDREIPRTYFNSSYIQVAKKTRMKWPVFFSFT